MVMLLRWRLRARTRSEKWRGAAACPARRVGSTTSGAAGDFNAGPASPA
jgi:hypothetical protein